MAKPSTPLIPLIPLVPLSPILAIAFIIPTAVANANISRANTPKSFINFSELIESIIFRAAVNASIAIPNDKIIAARPIGPFRELVPFRLSPDFPTDNLVVPI